jgi:methionyl-tRNA synthetase
MKKEVVQYPDFAKVDLRVGKVLEASKLEKSKKLLLLKVDLGEEYGTVTILSGIGDVYAPEELVGNNYMFVANLAPRQMMGYESQGMLMAANIEEKAGLISVSNNIPLGCEII